MNDSKIHIDERAAGLDVLAPEACQVLGLGWTVTPNVYDGNRVYSYDLHGPEGVEVGLKRITYGAGKGRITATMHWPEANGRHYFPSTLYTDIDYQNDLTVADGRGGKALGNAIRRMLDRNRGMIEFIKGRIVSDREFGDGKVATAEKIGEVLGQEPKGDYRDPSARDYTFYTSGLGTVKVHSGNSVTIELRSLGAKTALKVLRLLKELEAPAGADAAA